MATSTIKSKQDTGWITLNSTYGCEYRVVNNIVFIHCKYNGEIPAETQLGVLPEQYRTTHIFRFPNYNIGSTSDPICLQVSNGVVVMISSGKWVNVCCSYPV